MSNLNIPVAVKNLRLCSAFRGHQPDVLDCIETSKATYLMMVDDQYTHITSNKDDEYRAFLVSNPSEKELAILSIDKKLVKQRDGGMADGAIFDVEKFYFVEFKDQAEGNTDEAILYTYDKAISQLHQAVDFFDKHIKNTGLTFKESVDVSCFMVVQDKFPRASSLEMNYSINFFIDNKCPIYFERKSTF